MEAPCRIKKKPLVLFPNPKRFLDRSKNIKQNSKTFFKYIMGKERVKTSVGTLRDSKGELVDDEGNILR